MKTKTLLLILVAGFAFNNAFSQRNAATGSGKNLQRQIHAIADSFRSVYQDYRPYAFIGDSVGFSVDRSGKRFLVLITKTTRIPFYEMLFESVNTLAANDNYFDKVIAHEIYSPLIARLAAMEDSLLLSNGNRGPATKLIQRIVYSDLINCLRYTDDDLFMYVKKSYLNESIVKAMKLVLENPNRTPAEAQKVIQSRRPHYSLADTAGYRSMKKAYKAGQKQYKDNIKKIDNWIRWAGESKMELAQWLKNEQGKIDKGFRDDYLREPIRLEYIIGFIGSNSLIDLAPSLEMLYVKDREIYKGQSYLKELRIDLILARLSYKNYQKEVLERITQAFQNPGKNGLLENQEYLGNLIYINSQDSYYTAAPLLLVKDSIEYLNDVYSFGAYCFDLLKNHIDNFPEFDEIVKRDAAAGKIAVLDVELADQLAKDGFLDRMYRWMIENKGKYQLH